MPPADSTALIVARFLKTNGFDASYDAFIAEAGLPQDAGTVSKGDLTLETLLDEKRTFDVSTQFEKLGVETEVHDWTEPAPSRAAPILDLPGKSNLLSASIATVESGHSVQPFLFATAASRRLYVLDIPSCTLRTSTATLHDSPILSCAVLRERILITASMSGQLIASDLEGNALDKRRDHSKYIVKVAILHDPSADTVATAGWDNKINIYQLTDLPTFIFSEPIATISLPTKPEAMLLCRHPDSNEPMLIITRTDSNFLYFYTTENEPRLFGKQNLAPHSNAWVAFTPSAIALSPNDSTLLAVSTNSVPSARLLIVRLLIPPFSPPTSPTAPQPTLRRSLLDDNPVAETQASQARAALTIADREAAAIQIHCNTSAPQTAYSTPAVAWRPDASGIYVNGDDGIIRGIEASTGKVKLRLSSATGGHEEGSKVRCLCTGIVNGKEWLVSGGFDQQLIVWKIDGTS